MSFDNGTIDQYRQRNKEKTWDYYLEKYDKRDRENFVHPDNFQPCQVGDTVRVFAHDRHSQEGETYHVTITKIDKYRYGGVNKVRKYHGVVFYSTVIFSYILKE